MPRPWRPCGPLQDNVETALGARGREFAHLDAVDAGVRRPAPAPGEQTFDALVRPLGEDLDATVRQVAHAARKAQAARLPPRFRAEKDALDEAEDARMDSTGGGCHGKLQLTFYNLSPAGVEDSAVDLRLSADLDALAPRHGFFAWGAADAGEVADRGRYLDFLARGYHGGMAYLARNQELRIDPRRLLPGARSVLVFLRSYAWPAWPVPRGHGRVAAYARGKDYHRSMRNDLRAIAARLGADRARAFVDTGPVLERYWARASGAAAVGKNGLCLRPDAGSRFFIGIIVTTLHCPPSEPAPGDPCAGCDLCLRSCPTGALVAPRVLDATRCLSYLTIEHRGAIPPEFRAAMGVAVFGCDRCQDVCPYNRAPLIAGHEDARPRPPLAAPLFADLLFWNEPTFHAIAAQGAVARASWRGIQRNALIAAANSGDRALVEAYARRPSDPTLAALAAELLAS